MKMMWTTEIQILNGNMIVAVVVAIQAIATKPKKMFWDFNAIPTPLASALALQCSTIWAMKTHTLGAGHFVEFILTRESSETWNMHLL